MVYVSNLSGGKFHYLAGRFPGHVGHLYSPAGWRRPSKWMPYALDNGAYKSFDAPAFTKMLSQAKLSGISPRFVTVPDSFANRTETLDLWREWAPKLRAYGWPLAFVAQDGMNLGDVPIDADFLFVGGSWSWKLRTLERWCEWPGSVHVGKINTERLLWLCDELGAASVDGTGWWHDKQFDQLLVYLECKAGDRKRSQQMVFA